MADLADVMDALAAAATSVVYPAGTSAPSAIGVPVQIAQGWPLASTLDIIAAKPGQTTTGATTLVTVYAVPGSTGDAGTVMDWTPGIVSQMPPGISASVDSSGTVATFAGLALGGEAVSLIINGAHAYGYACQADDTVEVIAAALAAKVAVDFPDTTWEHGTGSVSVPGTFSLVARVGGTATIGRKVHRQKTQFRIVVWSSNPADRTSVAKAIDAAIKAQVQFAMPDTSIPVITYQGTNLDDGQERAGLYRRDLIYSAIYDTIEEFQAVEVTSVGLTASLPGGTTLSPAS